MSSSKANKLNRFTTLPVLLDMLVKNRLVFSDPKFWGDKNDTEILDIYKKAKPVNALFVLCFLLGHETIHHWNAFADGISGCCVEFDKAKLKKLFSTHKKDGVRFRNVVYKKLTEDVNPHVDMIPFQKRHPYKVEREFRVICEKDTEEKQFEIKIDPLEVITKVTLSPNMPYPLFETTKAFLEKRFKIQVNPSTLYRNSDWIKKFEKFKRPTQI